MCRFLVKKEQRPRMLYHVQYRVRGSKPADSELEATDVETFLDDFDEDAFTQSIKSIFEEEDRSSTPFISLYSKRRKAEDLALKYARRENKDCYVYTVKASEIYLFAVETLRGKLILDLYGSPTPEYNYVCLHTIDEDYIVESRDVWAIKEEQHKRAEERDRLREEKEGFMDVNDDDDDDDDDEAALANNVRDNAEKMLDGDYHYVSGGY